MTLGIWIGWIGSWKSTSAAKRILFGVVTLAAILLAGIASAPAFAGGVEDVVQATQVVCVGGLTSVLLGFSALLGIGEKIVTWIERLSHPQAMPQATATVTPTNTLPAKNRKAFVGLACALVGTVAILVVLSKKGSRL